jgi:hypothetical protein
MADGGGVSVKTHRPMIGLISAGTGTHTGLLGSLLVDPPLVH